VRRPFVIRSSGEPAKSPRRTRLLSGDFILDIVETEGAPHPFTYLVHRRSSGEILTLGDAPNFERAERIAIWTIRQITGVDPGFSFAQEPHTSSVA